MQLSQKLKKMMNFKESTSKQKVNNTDRTKNQSTAQDIFDKNKWNMFDDNSLEIYPEQSDSIEYPKRLENPLEMFKYFVSRTSLHGIKYGLDDQLYAIERIIWALFVTAGLFCVTKVIIAIYTKLPVNQTQISVDEMSYANFHVPFPSVTFCPSNCVDWDEVVNITNTLVSSSNSEANRIIPSLLKNISNSKFPFFNELNTDVDFVTLQILNRINLTDTLIKVMPKCEQLIFNCTWGYARKNCCEIFEIQKTDYGLCYAFNSLTSVEGKLHKPRKTHTFGSSSGLKFIIRKDYLRYPLREEDRHPNFIISYPFIYPSKARYVTFGKQYHVGVRSTSVYSSSEVLDKENESDPPCKHENGSYTFEKCLHLCKQKLIQKICGCTPAFIFPFNGSQRECNLIDLKCIAKQREQIVKVHLSMTNNENNLVKSMCACPRECQYCAYDEIVTDLPYHEPNSILMDIYFDGPMGIRYKRDIVISNLDAFVQLGGVFGLVIGGSIMTVMEFLYCLIVVMIFYVHRNIKFSSRKKKEIKVEESVNITAHYGRRIYPLLDFPIPINNSIPEY